MLVSQFRNMRAEDRIELLAQAGAYGDAGDEGSSVERRLEEKDAKRVVDAALERLPEEFREVIVLRELEGLSYKEIAAVAAIPLGTVMSRLARARKLLLHSLQRANKES